MTGFPTRQQIVWLVNQRVSGLSDRQLDKVIEISMRQLMIRKGIGRIWLVDSNGNQLSGGKKRKTCDVCGKPLDKNGGCPD